MLRWGRPRSASNPLTKTRKSIRLDYTRIPVLPSPAPHTKLPKIYEMHEKGDRVEGFGDRKWDSGRRLLGVEAWIYLTANKPKWALPIWGGTQAFDLLPESDLLNLTWPLSGIHADEQQCKLETD